MAVNPEAQDSSPCFLSLLIHFIKIKEMAEFYAAMGGGDYPYFKIIYRI